MGEMTQYNVCPECNRKYCVPLVAIENTIHHGTAAHAVRCKWCKEPIVVYCTRTVYINKVVKPPVPIEMDYSDEQMEI